MADYMVTWTVNIEDVGSPAEAAAEARTAQLEGEAQFFMVQLRLENNEHGYPMYADPVEVQV